MQLQRIKQGFTLIELLVVITIIGILAVGGVSVFTTQLQGARDSTRINDLKLMETAIHQYFSDETEYPKPNSFSGQIKDFMSKTLKDPKGIKICWDADTVKNNIECGGYYMRTNDSFGLLNSAFKLGISFEKKVNMQKKSTGSYDGGNNASLFEVFAGAGANNLTIGASGSTVGDYDGLGMNTYTGATNGSLNVY